VFDDPAVGAAAGQVRVRNRGSLLTRLQALEYALMNGIPRLAQSNFAHVMIAPGPVAMFQRSVLREIWSGGALRNPKTAGRPRNMWPGRGNTTPLPRIAM